MRALLRILDAVLSAYVAIRLAPRLIKDALTLPDEEPVRDAIHVHAHTLMDRETRRCLVVIAAFSVMFTLTLSWIVR